MASILRAAAIYIFLLIVFRLAGNRAVAQITSFDFILLLIISEAIQGALITEDYSVYECVSPRDHAGRDGHHDVTLETAVAAVRENSRRCSDPGDRRREAFQGPNGERASR